MDIPALISVIRVVHIPDFVVCGGLALAGLISIGMDFQKAGKKYYALRAPVVADHIEFGRSIKQDFLNPGNDGERPKIPLIQNLSRA